MWYLINKMSNIEIDSVNHHMPLSMHVQTSTKKKKNILFVLLWKGKKPYYLPEMLVIVFVQ